MIRLERDAWLAGYDCEKNGATIENCHFSFFAKPELTAAWEKGRKAAKGKKQNDGRIPTKP